MKRYWMMNTCYEFVEVTEDEYKNGTELINNSIVANIRDDRSVMWDIYVCNISGSDIAAINKIVSIVEEQVLNA